MHRRRLRKLGPKRLRRRGQAKNRRAVVERPAIDLDGKAVHFLVDENQHQHRSFRPIDDDVLPGLRRRAGGQRFDVERKRARLLPFERLLNATLQSGDLEPMGIIDGPGDADAFRDGDEFRWTEALCGRVHALEKGENTPRRGPHANRAPLTGVIAALSGLPAVGLDACDQSLLLHAGKDALYYRDGQTQTLLQVHQADAGGFFQGQRLQHEMGQRIDRLFAQNDDWRFDPMQESVTNPERERLVG